MATKMTIGVLATTLMLGSCVIPAMGQAAAGGGAVATPGGNAGGGGAGGGGNGGGQGRRFDPAQMRQRMMDALKDQLGASDDEFAALQPKIEKVTTLQRDLQSGRMQLFGRRGGGQGGPGGQGGQGGPGGNTQPTGAVQSKVKDLQDTLDNKDAKPEDIKAKLDALRDAKSKAKDELAAAQKELKDVLTQRQEAVLVEMGIVD